MKTSLTMRLFTGFLALIMLFGMVPMDVHATGTDDIYIEEASGVDLDMAEITELVEGPGETEPSETVQEEVPETTQATEPETVPETEPAAEETEPAAEETEPVEVETVTVKTEAKKSGTADAASAAELEAALTAGATTIRIAASFEIDRTFYITKDTVIYTESAQTLTRAADFAGDMFVVGEAADGTVCPDAVKLTLGKADSETKDLLIIDGNQDNMTDGVAVAGSVLFLSGKGQADLYHNLTVQNAKKVSNTRTLEVENPGRVGGAVTIVTKDAVLNIFGGTYKNNAADDEETITGTEEEVEAGFASTLGGVIYTLGKVNIEGGLFEENHAAYGGVIYANGTELTIKKAEFVENTTSVSGGAIYAVATAAAMEETFFSGNAATKAGGALYATAVTDAEDWDITLKETEFIGNSSASHGGALHFSNGVRVFMTDVTVSNNQTGSGYYGGGMYATGAVLEINGGEFKKNAAKYGGAMALYNGTKAVFNKLNIEENTANTRGGAMYLLGAEDAMNTMEMYNSTIKKNSSDNMCGGICVYTASSVKIYKTDFIENTGAGSGGAMVFYSGTADNVLHSCTFTGNTTTNSGDTGYGGGYYISSKTGVSMYNCTATGNNADKGGFIYATTTGSSVTMSGLTVSGNTAEVGGPIIWGNSTGAKLYIDKSNYVDQDHTGEYDDAYWKAAIYNKLTVQEATIPIPEYQDYGADESDMDLSAVYDVDSAAKLATALNKGYENIRITKSFTIDRTFYVNKSVKIFSEAAVTLTRDPAFGGDIFVIGESEAGVPCGEIAVLTLGDPASKTQNLLIIDGNKDNMTADVVGSVIFVTGMGQADLYENLTVQNAKKVGNARTSDADHGVSYPDRIGGAVAILAAKSQMNIYGGTYKDNAVLSGEDVKTCYQGGAIYNFGTLNVYGGLFQGNHANNGGAFFNYRTLNLYKAEIKNNTTASSGGAIYAAASTACYTNVGGDNEVVESAVLFSGNNSGTNGGAIMGQMHLSIEDAVFDGNTAAGKGGAVSATECEALIADSTFKNNTAPECGGALYGVENDLVMKNCAFTGNESGKGGAAYLSGKTDAPELDVKLTECTFTGNAATADGGAVVLAGEVRAAITDGTFADNTAAANGGAIAATEVVLTEQGSTFTGNKAANGGALYIAKNTLAMTGAKFTGNTATADGGAIALDQTDAELINVEFGTNSAANGGAMALSAGTSASMNKITATGNQAGIGGAIYNKGAYVSLHNSNLKNNAATGNAGAVGVYENATFKAYDVVFEGNTAVNGGALEIISGSADNLLQTCTFTGNTATAKGGAVIVGAASKAELYNTTATGNAAANGGILYVADAQTNVKLGGMTVSGNTSDNGFVASGDEGAVLDLDKSNYTDSTADQLDKAYWAAAITGKMKVNDVVLEAPRYNEYGNEDAGEELQDALDVKSADELEAALKAGASEIRITESFLVDRTFYVTSSTTVFSTAKITLTRAPGFAGDIFVVGEKADLEKGTEEAPYEPICFRLGNPISDTKNLLTIDGNKDNMTVDVVGTVLFVYGPNHAETYDNLTVKNAHKVGNDRVKDGVDTDIISYPLRVGGSAIIMTKNSTVDIYGGSYINNSVRDETGDSNEELMSSQGGVIYNYGTLRIYGGLFEGNHGSRGGVFYNYRTCYIYNAEVKNNSSYSLGGVMYVPNSTACKTYIGLENDVVEPHVVFSGNHAGNTGGVLYAQKVVEIHNTVFEGNSTTKYGAAIAAYSGTFNLSNVIFKDNTATGAGGAIYGSKTNLTIKDSEFTGNTTGTYGGAAYMTGQGTAATELELHNVKIADNVSDSYGGAIVLTSGARGHFVQSEFTNNKAKSTEKGGGAVYVSGGLSTHTCSFTGNDAFLGGAVYSTASTLNLQNTTFADNTATDGAAVYMTGTTVTVVEGQEDEAGWDAELKNCTFTNNIASGSGGGVYMAEGARAKMKAMTFTGNEAKSTAVGGAAIYASAATLDINGATLTGNKASNYGGAMYIAADAAAVMNKLTAEQNNAAKYGGVIYTVGDVTVYNSTFKNNSNTSNHGAAIYANTNGVIKVYNSLFDSNNSGNNAGAIGVYTATKGNMIHTCTFTNNTAKGYGGAIFVSNKSGLELYRTIATGNSAGYGGFLYETTTGSDVTIGELTVSGNTDEKGAPIIWGNSAGAKLHIDPSTYVDLDHTGEYDDAYWKKAIYNKLTYDFVTVAVPYYLDYASIDPGDAMRDSVAVSSAQELEEALKGENKLIRIAEDFEIDRTFYITKEVYIFSTAPHVLTRAANFAGDIFVVGEDANGKSALHYGAAAHLTLGLPDSDKKDLLVIDGNRDMMSVPVTGSVIFMSNGSRIDLYENLTLQNCEKTGNVRVLNKSKYGISNAFRVAGTLILNASGSINIHGGKYINNSSAKIEEAVDKTSTIGGMIYTTGALNMDGGLFQGNQGGQGGVIYTTAVTRITKGKFIGNAGGSTGGVICLAGYSSTHLILGEAGVGEKVLFEGNSGESNGTCIYGGGKSSVIILGNTVMKDNTTDGNGTVNVYGQMTVRDTQFINNTTGNRGGAIYVSTAYDPATMPTRHVVVENCTFTGNKANLGGAIQMYAGSEKYANGSIVTVTNCTFENNTSNYYGGAVHLDLKSELNMSDCVLKGNTSTREGGAIYATNVSRVNVSNCKFEKNTAKYTTSGGGGAICIYKSFLTVKGSEFTDNTAAYRGGAIFALNNNTSEVLTIKDTTFSGNSAAESGGAAYLESIGSYMRRVNFLNNKTTSAAGYGGAITQSGGVLELDTSEMTGNSAAKSSGAISAFGGANVTLNAITATGNKTDGPGGFLYSSNATVKIYDSKLEGNTAGKNGGAMMLDNASVTRIYNCDLLSNTAVDGAAICAEAGGKSVLLHSCDLDANTASGNGGAMYVGDKTDFYIYESSAKTNTAKNGGVMYVNNDGTKVTMLDMTVSGNTASEAGPIIYGNSAKATLQINKALYTDADMTTELDAAYWAAAVAGNLKVTNVTTKPSAYTPYKQRSEANSSSSLKPIKSESVAPIFKLAKKSSDANINSTYNQFSKLKNKSNFQSRSTVKFPNINGQTVTVDTFVYPDHGKANNCTVGEGLLIYQAMCYKKAHPNEEVYIDIASYRFSVQAAININRNSRYFGYARQLEDVEYDKYGFVRVAYLLVAAAKMGIHVNVVGHLDAYPLSSGEPRLKEYFNTRLRHTCDPAYVKDGGVVGDYLNFTFVEWSLKNRGGTDMMHNKMCAVSHYLDKDGKVHKNAVFSSSSNLDGIRPDGCNANWKLQTATIISDHAEIYNTAINYMRLTQEYATYLDGIMEFQHVVNERATKQIDLINAGKANEIPKNEQIVYIGTENDDVFELYFTPFGGDTYVWEEEYNPYCKYTRKLHNSEGYITFNWSAAEYSRHVISNQIESMVADALHKNRNLKNKLYIYAEDYDPSAVKDLKVGEDIGYLSINQKVHGTVHNKDVQFSYVENDTRYYVSLLNSLNVHGGTMSFQPNFALVIKETGICDSTSVYATIEKYSMGGARVYHDYGEKQLHMPTDGTHGYYYQKCRGCGAIKKLGTAHISGDWIVDRRATPTVNGIRHKACTICGKITESGEIVCTEPLSVDLSSLTGKTFTSGSTSPINLSLKGTPRTFEALVQVPKTVTGSAGVIVGNYSGGSGNQISLEISGDGRPYLYIKSSKKSASIRFNTDIRSDEPVHIAVSVDGNTASLYLNGEPMETATLSRSYPSASSSFKIGGDNRKSNKAYFRGRIYGVTLFSDARTAEEIKRDVVFVPNDAEKLLYTAYFNQELSQTALRGKTFGSSAPVALEQKLTSVPRTLEATIQVDKDQKERVGVIFGNYDGGKSAQMNLEIYENGRVRFYTKSSKYTNSCIFKTDIRSEEAVHIAVTVSGKTAKLYVNGEYVESGKLSRSIPTAVSNFKVGSDNTNRYFDGTIYNVNLFSDVRTAEEIKADAVAVAADAESLIYTCDFNAEGGKTFGETAGYDVTVSSAPRTIETVVQISTSFDDYVGVIAGNWDNSDAPQMNLEVQAGGKLNLNCYNNGSQFSHQFQTDIRSANPNHVTVTMEGTTANLYVNGSLKETATLTAEIPAAIGNFVIGADNTGIHDRYFNGKIYAVKMFSDVRTAEEVAKDRINLPEGAEDMIYCGVFEGNDLTAFYPEARTFTSSNVYNVPTMSKTPKTIEAVVQVPKTMNEYVGIITGNYSGSKNQMLLDVQSGGRVRLYFKTSKTTVDKTFKTDIRSDEPVHIAVTVSGKTARLYVNGVYKEYMKLKASLPSSIRSNFRIGGDARYGNTSYFKGKIYSLSMFSDVRSNNEIISDVAFVPGNASSLMYTKTFNSGDHDISVCTNASGHVSSDWIVDVEATETTNGVKHTACTVCGKRLKVSEILKTKIVEEEMNFNDVNAGLFFENEHDIYKVESKLATKTATIEVNLQLPKSQSSRAGTVLGNYTGGSGDQFNLEIYTKGRPKLWYKKGSKKYTCQFKTDVRSNDMVNLTITISGKTAKLYLNGKLKETKKLSATVPNVTSNFRIGGDNRDGNANYFKGTIYSVNVFNDVRSSSEVSMDRYYVPAQTSNLIYSKYFNAPEEVVPQ